MPGMTRTRKMTWQVIHIDYSDYGDTKEVLLTFNAHNLEAAKEHCRKSGYILCNAVYLAQDGKRIYPLN